MHCNIVFTKTQLIYCTTIRLANTHSSRLSDSSPGKSTHTQLARLPDTPGVRLYVVARLGMRLTHRRIAIYIEIFSTGQYMHDQ